LLGEPGREEGNLEENSDPEGFFIDSIEEYVLRECLKIMFPDCNIEIQFIPAVNSPNKEIHRKSD
jgi:hypothetical protein